MDQSAPNMIKVEDADSGTPTFVIDAKGKKHKLENGSWVIVPIPARVKMGKATILVRRGKAFIVKYICRRYWVDRRRILRKFDSTKDHDKRDLIIPTLSDPQYYGKSSI